MCPCFAFTTASIHFRRLTFSFSKKSAGIFFYTSEFHCSLLTAASVLEISWTVKNRKSKLSQTHSVMLRSGLWGGQSIVLRTPAASLFNLQFVFFFVCFLFSGFLTATCPFRLIVLSSHSGRMARNSCGFFQI